MNEKGEISKAPDMEQMRNDIYSVSVTDQETNEMIHDAYDEYDLILEPHGSVGWKGLMDYCKEYNIHKDQLCISLETAHPAKFPNEIIKILKFDPKLPESLQGLEHKEEKFDTLENDYLKFKKYLTNNYR